jgi:hypothetical protein
VSADRVRGDHTGLVFPAHADALRADGPEFLTKAFRAFGVLDADNQVVRIDRLDDVAGGSTGRKAVLDVRYAEHGSPTQLFVKFSRDFDNAIRDRGRTQMEAEVRFASLTQEPAFPITVPTTLFADYHCDSGTGLIVSERITFGANGIEPQYHKCLDYEMPRQIEHYRALLTAVGRLAGVHRAGKLPAHLVDQFPIDLRAATVGERVPCTVDRLKRQLARLGDFIRHHPGLFGANIRARGFISRLTTEAEQLILREPAIWAHLGSAQDYIALCHWNANVDNAWFWSDTDSELSCGLMDWGCVSQMNAAMAIWGALSGAETHLWDDHLDTLLAMFCDVVHDNGGPLLDPVTLRHQLVLYATLMGVTWLLDVPALLHKRIDDLSPQTTRTDPRIKGDEGVRAPLQMLTNVLNLWETRGVATGLAVLGQK